MRQRHKWTAEETQKLIEMYPVMTAQEIADLFNLQTHQIYNKAHALGLKKSKEWIRENARENAKNNPALKATRFKKGNVSWNKGKKMPPHPNSIATQFKKGNIPHNAKKKDGVISERDNKGVPYKMIRVGLGKWEFLNRHTWKKHHGPIPKGMCIAHKDGDPLNCDISNLEMITRAELMKRNTLHQWPKEIQETIILTNKINRKIKEHAE